MKLCILSDSHDNRALLGLAVEDAKAKGASVVLHCGDVVAPTTLRVLLKIGLPVHVIHGNNSGDLVNLCKLSKEQPEVIHYHGQDASLTLDGCRVFIVHYPHYAHAMALTGDYDIVCCGHDHRSDITHYQTVKGTTATVINPGTVGGVGAEPTYVLADLVSREFTLHTVPVKADQVVNRAPVTPHQ
ncbi:MAG: metallophosphoesterase family protein [Gammaproteobacteria bacterium]|nr:metallophosphoesterase family protein [Gammaproteobacteria bacterium]